MCDVFQLLKDGDGKASQQNGSYRLSGTPFLWNLSGQPFEATRIEVLCGNLNNGVFS
jgi:hypothetical protein